MKSVAAQLLIAAVLLCTSQTAFALRDDLSICPDPESIAQQIIMCGQDQFAADKAKQCSDKIIASWKNAAAELQPKLLRQSDNQNHSESDTKSDYDKTIAVLNAQIKYMQDGTTLIATYTRAMIDFPGSKSAASSAPCFNKAFDQVQDVVTNLDNEIVRAKNIRKLAENLRTTSDTRHAKFDNSLFDDLGAVRAAGVGAGRAENIASDVTGTAEDAAKRRSLASSGSSAKLSAPALDDASKAASAGKTYTGSPGRDVVLAGDASTLTRSAAGRNIVLPSTSAPGLGVRLDPGGVFSARGSLGDSPEARTAPSSRKTASAESVGSVLWREQGGDMNIDVAHERADKNEAEKSVDVAALAELPAGSDGLPSLGRSLASAGVPTHVAYPAVASAESDLFGLVSSRYRSTELFRRAKVTTVPLNGFDATLKR